MKAGMTATKAPVEERLKGFQEVEKGLENRQAILEANRCLMCDEAPCNAGCPAGIDVRGFIRRIRFGDYRGGVRILRDENILAGICGRVCPTETLCEEACRSQALTDPIRIGALQRFLTDWEMEVGRRPFAAPPIEGAPVAVVGAGPAGLAAAVELRLMGHPVTIFEARDYAGGTMRRSIPRFKLPREVIEYEVGLVEDLGVEIKYNTPLSPDRMPKDLLDQGFDAVLLAVGLQEPYTLGLEGEDLEGVYTALDVLETANGLRDPGEVSIGKEVVVIGGGSAGVNTACSALRMGAESVNLTSRRVPADMGAFEKDKQQALEEGVQFNSCFRPVRILGEDGHVTGVEGVRVCWTQKEGWAAKNVEDVPGSETVIPADTVVIAVGQRAEKATLRCIPGIETAANGCLMVDAETRQTSQEGVFAAGDILAGSEVRTVVQSIAEGKAAALTIREYLNG